MTTPAKIISSAMLATGLAAATVAIHATRPRPHRLALGEHMAAGRSPLMPVMPWAAQDAEKTAERKFHPGPKRK